MTKKQLFLFILLAVALSLAVNVFFGRWLAVKISTLPVVNRWKILSPQGPIVINTREEVRFSDAGDTLWAINDIKSKLSSVAVKSGTQIIYAGGAVNLTSDGLFLTTKSVIGDFKSENLYVKTDGGAVLPAQSLIIDPSTDLVILKTAGFGIATANFGDPKNLSSGEKIIFVANSFLDSSPFFENNYVAAGQLNNYANVYDANFPQRSFFTLSQQEQINGMAVGSLKGEVMGILSSGKIISGSVIKSLLANYFGGNGNLQRPNFGFKYKNISPAEALIFNSSLGAKITQVSPASPAQKAGLQINDVILGVGNNNLSKDTQLEELLEKYRPNDKLQISILRGKEKVNLNLTVGILK